MSDSPSEGDGSAPEYRGLKTVLFTLAVWIILIVLSFPLEFLFNSGSSVGSGGFAPVAAIFVSALLFGWIPALIAGIWKFRSR